MLYVEELTDNELSLLKESLFGLYISLDEKEKDTLCIQMYDSLEYEYYKRHYMKRGIKR
jgi:hypothetical protein